MKIIIEIPNPKEDFEGCYTAHVKTILTSAFAGIGLKMRELLDDETQIDALSDDDPTWAAKVRKHYKLGKETADALYHAPKTFTTEICKE